MHIPLAFELDNEELRQIEALSNDFENGLLDGLLDKTAEADKIFDGFSAIFREKSSSIRRRARKRSLAYYAEHHKELITALQEEITSLCLSRAYREKGEEFMFTTEKCPGRITRLLSPYLEILNENERQDILNFIDYTVRNRDKIFRDAQEKDTPAVSAITSRSQELKLETTRVGRIIFEREEKSGFSNEDFYNCDDEHMPEVFTGTHPKNRRKEIFTFVSLEIENLKQEVPAISRLEPFDGEVLSSSISLYADGNEYTTPDMIYRHMLGNKRGAKLHPQMREAILASLRKLRLTNIVIRAEQELEAGYSKKSRYEGVILPNEVIEDKTVSLNGENVRDCIHFLRNSPLYDYADDKNQISRLPVAMLDVPANNDKELIILKGYLARRYAEARNSNSKLGNIIRYDSIFEYLGIDSDNKKQTKRIRDTVKLILETWKKAGYITGYQEIKEGRIIAKIKIKLPRKIYNSE